MLFTGEMVFPFMFDDIAALRPLKDVADALAAKTDWPALYDVDALARCDVPVACASYVEDMFVDFELPRRRAGRSGQGLVHERVHVLGREGGRRADTDEADGDGARRGAAAVRAVRGGVSAG